MLKILDFDFFLNWRSSNIPKTEMFFISVDFRRDVQSWPICKAKTSILILMYFVKMCNQYNYISLVWSIFFPFYLLIKKGYTKVCNHPQLSTTTHNHPQPTTTIHNRPQPPTFIHSHKKHNKKNKNRINFNFHSKGLFNCSFEYDSHCLFPKGTPMQIWKSSDKGTPMQIRKSRDIFVFI